MLLSRGHIWDFRDIFLAAVRCFGLPQTCQKFFHVDSCRERVLEDWILYERDESTALAQLDILIDLQIHIEPCAEGINEMEWLYTGAQALAEEIMEKYPESTKSRPFTRWILTKATKLGLDREDDIHTGSQKPYEYLNNYPGYFLPPRWPDVPIYIPREFETPIWSAPNLAEEKEVPLQMALDLAMQLNDYETQALCLKLLIRRSQEPSSLFERLKRLQKHTQGDGKEYLHTCLSSYLICNNKSSQKQMLAELQEIEDWNADRVFRDPKLYFAKHFIERTLTAKINDQRSLLPLKRSTMKYYRWLDLKAQIWIDSLSPIQNPFAPATGYGPRLGRDENEEEYRYRAAPRTAPDMDPVRSAYEIGKEEARFESSKRRRPRAEPARRPPRRRYVHREQEQVVVNDLLSPSSSDWTAYSSSNYTSSSEDDRIVSALSKEINKARKEMQGGRVTLSFQHPKNKEEHTSVSWVKQGDYITTITEKKSKMDKTGKLKQKTRRGLERGKKSSRRDGVIVEGESKALQSCRKSHADAVFRSYT